MQYDKGVYQWYPGYVMPIHARSCLGASSRRRLGSTVRPFRGRYCQALPWPLLCPWPLEWEDPCEPGSLGLPWPAEWDEPCDPGSAGLP